MGTYRENENKALEPPENHWSQLEDVWQEEDADLTAEQQAELLEAFIWNN